MRSGLALIACLFLTGGGGASGQDVIPITHVVALDGHTVELPRDAVGGATVIILGFSKGSQVQTTAWGKRVLDELGKPPVIGFYEAAMLAPVPSLLRGLVMRSMKKSVPLALHPYFLPITEKEDEWKRTAGYAADAPDAAYVLLLDSQGAVRWKTHDLDSEAALTRLALAMRKLAGAPRRNAPAK